MADNTRTAQRRAELARERAPYGVGRTILAMLGMGLVLGLASIRFVGWIDGGEWPDRTSNLPFVFFSVGALWGLGVARSIRIRTVTRYLVVPLAMGVFFWVVALFAVAVLLTVGLPDSVADATPIVAFFLGAAVGVLPAVAQGGDGIAALVRRFRGGA